MNRVFLKDLPYRIDDNGINYTFFTVLERHAVTAESMEVSVLRVMVKKVHEHFYIDEAKSHLYKKIRNN